MSATYVRGLDLLFQDRATVLSYYAVDQLGSTRSLTNASGAVTDTYTYDAYGNPIGSTGTTINPYQYAGQRLDAGTGLYDMGARVYDASAGQFTSRDSHDGSTSNPITLNHYVYAGADPVDNVDPSGHDLLSVSISIGIGISLGGLVFRATGGNAITGALFGATAGAALAFGASTGRFGSVLLAGFTGAVANAFAEAFVQFYKQNVAAQTGMDFSVWLSQKSFSAYSQALLKGFATASAAEAFAPDTTFSSASTAGLVSLAGTLSDLFVEAATTGKVEDIVMKLGDAAFEALSSATLSVATKQILGSYSLPNDSSVVRVALGKFLSNSWKIILAGITKGTLKDIFLFLPSI